MEQIPSVFKRIRTMFSEEVALQKICKSKNLRPDQLQAQHTDKLWQWIEIVPAKQIEVVLDEQNELPSWKGPKEKFEREAAAVNEAMTDLETFEGNLRPEHTENYYVFKKIRG